MGTTTDPNPDAYGPDGEDEATAYVELVTGEDVGPVDAGNVPVEVRNVVETVSRANGDVTSNTYRVKLPGAPLKIASAHPQRQRVIVSVYLVPVGYWLGMGATAQAATSEATAHVVPASATPQTFTFHHDRDVWVGSAISDGSAGGECIVSVTSEFRAL